MTAGSRPDGKAVYMCICISHATFRQTIRRPARRANLCCLHAGGSRVVVRLQRPGRPLAFCEIEMEVEMETEQLIPPIPHGPQFSPSVRPSST